MGYLGQSIELVLDNTDLVTSIDGNTGTISANDVLTTLTSVDGSGSGLDADLLDGNNSDAFESSDPDILKADTSDLLQTVFGDEGQVYTGTDLSGLTATRNHILWTLTAASQFSADATLPYTGTYVFHVYPSTYALTISTSYKNAGNLSDPDSTAGEIRIVVEYFNSRLTILSLQNMEA